MAQNKFWILTLLLISLDIYVWTETFRSYPGTVPEIYFLDVGQGDATLLMLPPGVAILTDAGRDSKILESLAAAVPALKRIDLAVISHPQLDHFNGFRFLIEKYAIGAVILNGRNGDVEVSEWQDLLGGLRAKNIPVIVLGGSDSIEIGKSKIEILGPAAEFKESGELNDTAIVEFVKTPDWTALLAADIGFNIEDFILPRLQRVDILKVGHHGSKYSSGNEFLAVLKPKVAAISVGNNNQYGHPSPAALSRLTAAGIQIFRTDRDGSINIRTKDSSLQITSIKDY